MGAKCWNQVTGGRLISNMGENVKAWMHARVNDEYEGLERVVKRVINAMYL
jgi:hypothetical protein